MNQNTRIKKGNMKLKIIFICMIFLLVNMLNLSRESVGATDSSNVDAIFAQGEKGPIDLNNKNEGVQQIHKAGITDQNFAEAIWDAFKENNYQGDDSQTIRQILAGYSGTIDASNRGIKKIEGIEYLRYTTNIDFSNKSNAANSDMKNEISDLTPITIDHIRSIAPSFDVTEPNWFLNKGNLRIRISGNPIKEYGDSVGGLLLYFSGEESPAISTENLISIKKESNKDWQVTKNISLPTLKKNGQEVYFSEGFTSSSQGLRITRIDYNTMNADVKINYSELKNRILQITNIRQSGVIYVSLGIDIENEICFFKRTVVAGGLASRLDLDTITFAYQTSFTSRIYMPVTVEKDIKTNIKVKKSAAHNDSGKKVIGAKYYLYDANTNKMVSDKEYITDENGEFLLNEYLPVGKYYFKEFEAPEGFLINEDKISFNVDCQCDIHVSGGDKNLNINAGDIKEDPDTVYIDRYSNNVEVNVTDDPNYTLDHIELTYFDYDTQKTKTIIGPEDGKIFTTGDEIAEWINSHKGNADAPGIIDGEVKIKAYFADNEKPRELSTSDQRSATDVEFTKKGKELNKKGEVIYSPLSGAAFRLECTHKHTEQCKDKNGGYRQCTDPHTDEEEYWTEDGCSWNKTVTSGKNGEIKFEKVNTGTYKMVETKAPNGYLLPETTWMVDVEADNDSYTIKSNKKDHSVITEQEKYVILNEKKPTVNTSPEMPNKPSDNNKTESKGIGVKTGDRANTFQWSCIAVLSGGLATFLLSISKRNNIKSFKWK